MPLADFTINYDISQWRIVDDVVMGGRSDGNMALDTAGNAVFSGRVSLENNGGFSSVRHRFPTLEVAKYKAFSLKIKGDGKRYQLRVKPNSSDRHSYIAYFETTGDWQTISVPFADMYPNFRGRELDMPNYAGEQMEEMAFLIANGQAEKFHLEIDWIGLE